MTKPANNIPVIMYHHVASKHESLTVTATNFESQIKGLAKQGYKALDSTDIADFYAGKPLPKKSVLITFDDGYLDNWVYAHPVLKKYNMKAILFVVTGLIGNGAPRPFNGQGKALPVCAGHHEAKQIMFSPQADDVMLRWSEIHSMLADNTFEIHSHTHTHKRWDLLDANTKNERIYNDLEQSLATLKQQTGTGTSHLCWPQGYFDADYTDIANKLGFKFLYTTDARGQNTVASNSNHIYRFAVRDRQYGWLRQRMWLATHPKFGPIYNNWKASKGR